MSLSVISRRARWRNRSSSHLHLAVADSAGHMTGGHLKQGCQIRLGAKIVLAYPRDLNPEPAD